MAEYKNVSLQLSEETYARLAQPLASKHRNFVWSGLLMSLCALFFLVSFILYWVRYKDFFKKNFFVPTVFSENRSDTVVPEEIFMFAPGLVLTILFLILYVPLYKYDPLTIAEHTYYTRVEVLMQNASGYGYRAVFWITMVHIQL